MGWYLFGPSRPVCRLHGGMTATVRKGSYLWMNRKKMHVHETKYDYCVSFETTQLPANQPGIGRRRVGLTILLCVRYWMKKERAKKIMDRRQADRGRVLFYSQTFKEDSFIVDFWICIRIWALRSYVKKKVYTYTVILKSVKTGWNVRK